ncbi:alkaline phosphatase family protein [Rathayibacter sp. VKM Ac-2760]|uniref:alkaline phosphatase family protein n=1 Tax=Rathayibacter sp. VKM Ac-2760 TaxID=2609253 RepID=UPI0013193570|nr:alkaline phosphatase family protein [Rathayibacter sp. VKM Ac-2760]QHC59058.1 hypothetical protein GSU72_11205 [Rathayibacter sp. VKM Ac-2760]
MSGTDGGTDGGNDTGTPWDDAPRSRSRRRFLAGSAVAGGVAAAGITGGAIGAAVASGRDREAESPLPERSEPGFDHVVVVMFENRSFDNILGQLYAADGPPAGATFEGLQSGEHSNTTAAGDTVAAHVYQGATDTVMRQPDPDPGEEFPHVNTQLFGTIDPPENAGASVGAMTAPFNAPADASAPTMSGFLEDYVQNLRHLKKGEEPTREEYGTIMGGFSPDMLPVFSTLAREFAVFDHWFCAVPSQTFCNRSFFHASTSHGFVTNKHGGGYEKWLADDLADAPTVFNRLEEAGKSWRVYFDALQVVSYTGFLHAPVLEKHWKTNFAPMEQFYADVASGDLPDYAFVEPRLVFDHNDMHPPTGVLHEDEVDGQPLYDSALSDVRAGELLLHQVYSAIRESASTTGSNAINTLLLATFDEHGGLYDHVPPPAATPPGDGREGEMGFGFDRLGCRVPAIAISAYTRAGTVLHDEMHHGALIRTLSRLHGLEPLTARDADAPDLFGVVTLDSPRQIDDWPTTVPQYLPPNPEATPPHPANANRDKPLSPPALGLMGLLLARYGEPGDDLPTTYQGAYEALLKHGTSLFGTGTVTASPSPSPTPSPGT